MKMRIFTYILICFVALTMTSSCSKEQESPAADKFYQALDLQEDERYKDALRLYHKAVQIDPNYEEAYIQIASIYDDHLEDKDRAVEWYQKYLDISQNEKQKQLVKKWLDDAKTSALEISSGAKGDLAKLSPQVRALIKKYVSLERAKIKQEFKAKEKSLSGKHKNKSEDFKEELAEIKAENIELKDKLENITIDLNAAQKNSARDNIRNKLAGLLSSVKKSKKSDKLKDKVSTQEFIDLKTQLEGLKVQLNQERAKGYHNDKQVLSLKDDIRKLKQLQKTSNKTKAYQKQIEELLSQKSILNDKVKLLEDAAEMDRQSKSASSVQNKNDEIRSLQNRIAVMKEENTKVLADKHRVEQSLAQLQERLDELAAGSSDTDLTHKTLDENKKLRLQIAKITTKFNEISVKHNSAEQIVQELQSKINGLKDLPQASHSSSANDNFKDLSEEITTMQKTIMQQKAIIDNKNAQLSEVIRRNLKIEESLENKQNDNKYVQELNALLVEKNKQIQELTDKSGKIPVDLELSTDDSKQLQILSEQVTDLRAQLFKKNKTIENLKSQVRQ